MAYPRREDHELFAHTIRLVAFYIDRSPQQIAAQRHATTPEAQEFRELEERWEHLAHTLSADASQAFSVFVPEGSAVGRRLPQMLSAFEIMLVAWPDSELARGWDTLGSPPDVAHAVLPGLQALAYARPGMGSPALDRLLERWQCLPFDGDFALRQTIGLSEALGLKTCDAPAHDSGPNTSAARRLVETLGRHVGFEGSSLKKIVFSQLALWKPPQWDAGPPALAMALLEKAPLAWWREPVGDVGFLSPIRGTLAEQVVARCVHASRNRPPIGFQKFTAAVQELELNSLLPPGGPRPQKARV